MTFLTSWLLTYLLHSTLLLGAAALLCHVLGERRLGLQEAVLRAALVGSFLTASLQLGLGLQPLGGVFALPEEPPAVRAEPELANGATPVAGDVEVIFGSLPSVLEKVRNMDEVAPGPAGWSFPAPSVWRPGLTGLWAAVALLALARMAVAAVRLRRLLRWRHPLANDDLTSKASALAARLGLRRPVPLSTAPRLEVPLATGVLRPEVCLPTRALQELGGEQQVALCAHELAHVARRDPTWILAARLAEALAPIQPLNTWARRRLEDLAECLSDDLAVAASGRPLGLARSLVDVASWTVAEPVSLPAASGALSSRSRLRHRVERLMDPLRSVERPHRFLLPVAGAAVLATALVTPVVSGHPAGEPSPVQGPPDASEARDTPAAPEAAAAPTAPEAPEAPRSDAAQRLEELTRAIGERVEAQQAAMAEIEAEVEGLVPQNLPDQEELARLGREVEVAARALAEARRAEHEGGVQDEKARQDVKEARRQLKEAQEQIHEAARAVHIPEEQMRRLREKAREIAHAARPTPEEREEIHRLAREVARESMGDMSELRDEMTRMSRQLERESLSSAREAMREAQRRIREALRVWLPEVREAARAAHEAAHEAAREAHEAARQAREEHRHESAGRASEGERTRRLEEAEESHLEETPETDEP